MIETGGIPRISLGHFPTPLHPVSDDRALWVKRDDLTGFAWAGNKARPLEFLMAEAGEQGASHVVGGGLSTSNFIAALASAACQRGLRCHLLVPSPIEPTTSIRLARLAGAVVEEVTTPRDQLDEAIERRATELAAQGHAAYPIPRGGANSTGALGFAAAAAELQHQLVSVGWPPADPCTVVIPVGSGASIAGLVAGTALAGTPLRIVGVSVSRSPDEIEAAIARLSGEVVTRLGADAAALASCDVHVIDRRSPPSREDARRAAGAMACRGLLVDDHYGLPAWLAAQEIASEQRRVVLWLTGGMAGVPHVLAEVER
ncbi:MAG: 1-aminocyclopropane-1-carboxylate deaminase/D-cysteine desulfhydrase [Actinomycetota bacterium]